MSETIFSINGKLLPEEKAVVPATDRGLLYGDGLFETIHAYGRKCFRLQTHLDRLRAGADKLRFDPLPDLKLLRRWLQAAVDSADFAEANVRLTFTRGSGPRGPSLPKPMQPLTLITVTRYRRHGGGVPVNTAIIASFRRQEAALTANLKTLNYIEQILARQEADAAGADEALLLNNAGLLCEGSASNINLIRDGVLLAPDPLRSGALPGIAQLTAFEAAANLKIPVRQQSLSPWDPAQSQEAFLTGSMREITPLVRLDNNVIGGGKPGALTLKLIKEYRRIVERECRPFKFKK